jgi:hypothetical protein
MSGSGHQDLIYSLAMLEQYLWSGSTIKWQEGKWWLFNEDGDGKYSGETLKDLLLAFRCEKTRFKAY